MKTNHYTRQGYERLYLQLRNEDNTIPYTDIRDYHKLTDYQLLREINKHLIQLNCIPLTWEELEIELH
jgi:hypothetical protein